MPRFSTVVSAKLCAYDFVWKHVLNHPLHIIICKVCPSGYSTLKVQKLRDQSETSIRITYALGTELVRSSSEYFLRSPYPPPHQNTISFKEKTLIPPPGPYPLRTSTAIMIVRFLISRGVFGPAWLDSKSVSFTLFSMFVVEA